MEQPVKRRTGRGHGGFEISFPEPLFSPPDGYGHARISLEMEPRRRMDINERTGSKSSKAEENQEKQGD